MKTYKDSKGEVWAFEDDGSQDDLITPDMVLMTDEEIEAHEKAFHPDPIPLTDFDHINLLTIPAKAIMTIVEAKPWNSGKTYTQGDVVTHEGQHYLALPDVTTGIEPDDIFDDSDYPPTGGWKPI